MPRARYNELYQAVHTAPNAHTVLMGLVDDIVESHENEDITLEEHDSLIYHTIYIARQLSQGYVNVQ